MNKNKIVIMCFLILCITAAAYGQEQQQSQTPIQQPVQQSSPIDQAQEKAEQDAARATKEAALKEAEILYERGELKAKVAEMQKAKKEQDRLLESLNKQYHENDKEIERLQKRLDEQEGAMNEVSGSVRGLAQDTATLLRRSIVSGERPQRDTIVEPLLSELEFPSLENIQKMTDVMFDEIERNGTIEVKTLNFVDASGKETRGEVMRIGAFNAIFRQENRVGYLEYATVKQAFHELIVTPPREMTKEARKFFTNESQGLYLDLSAGGAFRQLTDMPSWYEQLQSGGALMYPLLGVGLFALILVLERLMVLVRESKTTESLSDRIASFLQTKKWNEALRLCNEKKGSLADVLKAGINHRHERVEVLESVMAEAIQSTLPRLERNMSALQILGMVAPLLGLLGTVTGMIATFQMITLYGTGDPKIMSGGISEALVTTQYGLIVAIPIILIHGYFQGRIDNIIGNLEEKAIMLVNAARTGETSGE